MTKTDRSRKFYNRGASVLWVIFVVNMVDRSGSIWDVRIEFLKGSALKFYQPAHLRHGKKDAYVHLVYLDSLY